MKIKIIIFCVCISIFQLTAQKKSGSVIYKVANVDFDYKGNNEGVRNMLEIARQQQYSLKFNNSYSSFALVHSMLDETIDEFTNSRAQRYVAEYDYYFDYKNDIVLEDGGNGILIQQKRSDISWIITSESKDIDNYKCYKATYSYEVTNANKKVITRSITAWFSPSLPYAYGPKNFGGLPGLILELTYVNITFLATSIELYDKQIEVKIPSFDRVSREAYDKELFKNFGHILKK